MKYTISTNWEKAIRDLEGRMSKADQEYIFLAVKIRNVTAEEAEAVFDLYDEYFTRYEAEYQSRMNCETDMGNGNHIETFAFRRVEGWVGSIKEDVAEHCRDLKKIVRHYESIAAARADLEEIGNHRDFDEYLEAQAANNTEEEQTMKYEISFIRNNVNQCNIYEARTEEAAQAYFAEKKPDATICGISEHRGSIKPGMPVVIVPAEWESRYWDEISSRVYAAVSDTFRSLEAAGVISDLEIEPIPAQPLEILSVTQFNNYEDAIAHGYALDAAEREQPAAAQEEAAAPQILKYYRFQDGAGTVSINAADEIEAREILDQLGHTPGKLLVVCPDAESAPDPDEIRIDEIREGLNLGDYAEYLNDYRDSSSYICDAIAEIADNNVSIYYCDQIRFISENPEALADVIEEGLYDPSRHYNLWDHAGAAEYMVIERDLYEHLRDGLLLAALDFIQYDLGRDAIPGDLADLVQDWCDDANSDNRMSEIPDKIREYFEAAEEDENE